MREPLSVSLDEFVQCLYTFCQRVPRRRVRVKAALYLSASRARYRIHAVAEATGLSAATLRAWERRYGIPEPTRGESGYRLYTERDVEQVRRMVELGETGVAPSEAARIVRAEISQADAIPVDDAPGADSDAYDAMVSRIVAAAEALDQTTLEREIYTAMGMGSAWDVYQKVLSPVLEHIGAHWESGRLTVGHEHLASHAIGTALRSLVRLLIRPGASRVVLLACVEDEQHDLPLYGVAVLAAALGWLPRVLGVRTPPAALAPVVEGARPALVGLSVTVPLVPDDPEALFAAYGEACGEVRWLVGGAAARRYRDAIEAAGGELFDGDSAALRAVLED